MEYYLNKIIGKSGISATVIADSINASGNRLTTFEWEYPRFIHSEAMTHKMLSKNAASSRAIPFKSLLDLILNTPAMPVHWGKNQSGMKAREELDVEEKIEAQRIWIEARDAVIAKSIELDSIGLHKQLLNRLLEPWQTIKTVVSGTEFTNLFWLRDHQDAQPEFGELASVAHEAINQSVPTFLEPGQWHLPYVDQSQNFDIVTGRKISASCCAQVSYRRLDDSTEKALKIYDMLGLESTDPEFRKHASPVEHQGTPISASTVSFDPSTWEDGITHVSRNGSLWSANFQGWIQHRQLIPGHVVW